MFQVRGSGKIESHLVEFTQISETIFRDSNSSAKLLLKDDSGSLIEQRDSNSLKVKDHLTNVELQPGDFINSFAFEISCKDKF